MKWLGKLKYVHTTHIHHPTVWVMMGEGRKEGRKGALQICCFSAILNFVAFKGCNFF
jgi:hypothetical protein